MGCWDPFGENQYLRPVATGSWSTLSKLPDRLTKYERPDCMKKDPLMTARTNLKALAPADRRNREVQRTRQASSHPAPDVSHDLAALLEMYIARDRRSVNQIAIASLLDVAYLWRLRNGTKTRPSRDVLIRLGLTLRLDPEELDELLLAANYARITGRRA